MLGHISKYFERPEGTHEYVAEMDGLRNCACSILQHKTFYMGENMLAASNVARFYSLATVDIFSAKKSMPKKETKKFLNVRNLGCGLLANPSQTQLRFQLNMRNGPRQGRT
jgi:hypothetical protein